jgi:hypothetical protein
MWIKLEPYPPTARTSRQMYEELAAQFSCINRNAVDVAGDFFTNANEHLFEKLDKQ